jgi:glycerol-3-phosphate cytidylyltransferase
MTLAIQPTSIGYAAGAFDLFHVGHLNILRRASENCDYLIAGVVSDELLIRSKGKAPVVPLAERLEIVSSVKFVDRAVAEDLPTKLEMWERLRFTHFFKGDDWRGTAKGIALEREFAEVGVEIGGAARARGSTRRRGSLARSPTRRRAARTGWMSR